MQSSLHQVKLPVCHEQPTAPPEPVTPHWGKEGDQDCPRDGTSTAHLRLPVHNSCFAMWVLDLEGAFQPRYRNTTSLRAVEIVWGRGAPAITHKFKISKALSGSCCYKSCYLLMGFGPKTPTCCFEIFLHLFISTKLIYLGQEKWPTNVSS